MDADALLQACDAALLRSKRQGKGRVTRALDTLNFHVNLPATDPLGGRLRIEAVRHSRRRSQTSWR